MRAAAKSFGTCCSELREALGGDGDDFEPLLTVGQNGILYLAIGMIEADETDPTILDHPVYYCPFCGTHLQSPGDVRASASGRPRNSDE
jgi:hypothetical protein